MNQLPRCLLLVLLVLLAASPLRAQQAPAVVFHDGPTPEQARARSAALHASLRSAGADARALEPMLLLLQDADLEFLASGCTECDGAAQLIPAGVSRQLDWPLDFTPLTADVLARGSVEYAGGRAGLGADGVAWWATALESPGAEGLRLHLREVAIPPGAELVLYSVEGEAQGPYTQRDVAKSGSLWTLTVSSPRVFLEVRWPVKGPSPTFTIHEAGIMVEPVVGGGAGPPEGSRATSCDYADCYMEYACIDPAVFPNLLDISNATARIRFAKSGSFYLCSGGLVNDNRGQENLLFVTAAHCLSTQASAESIEFRWRYRSETCGAGCIGTGGSILTTGGADLLATSSSTDFTMVALVNPPPAGSVFLGWDAQTNYANTAGIPLYRVHHPGGNMQHVTSYWTNTSLTSCTARPRTRYIQVTRNVGFTAGGSSGSLLVNGDAQMVGQFYGGCGNAGVGNCDPNRIHVDGQFRVSYPLVEAYLTPVGGNPGVYTYNSASGSWNDATAWTPARAFVVPGDVLLFNGNGPSGDTITITDVPTQDIGGLRLVGGASVVLQSSQPLATLRLVNAGASFNVGVGSTLELRGATGADLRVLLDPGVTGTVQGDVIFAAQDDGANPRLVSTTVEGIVFDDGSSAAVAPAPAVATDSLTLQRGGFGDASDGAVDGGVLFREGSTWHQGGRKDGTRGGAQVAGPHGLAAPAQATRFDRGSTYIVWRGGLATPRDYPTVLFRDDAALRALPSGAVIDGDLVISDAGPNAQGIGALNLTGTLDPALTILGDLVIEPGASVPTFISTATPASPSRVRIAGDVISADPAKFPAGLNGRRWVLDGDEPQVLDLGGAKTLHRVGIENLAGATIAHDLALTGSLELTAGPMILGEHALLMGGTPVNTPVDGWIVGAVRRTLDPTSTSTTRFFHVGTMDGASHARILGFAPGGTAGELTVRCHGGEHPTAALDGTLLPRWWSMAPAAGLSTAGASLRVSLDWRESDLPEGATPYDLAIARLRDGSDVTVWLPGEISVDTSARSATVYDIDDLEGEWLLFVPTPPAPTTWMLR